MQFVSAPLEVKQFSTASANQATKVKDTHVQTSTNVPQRRTTATATHPAPTRWAASRAPVTLGTAEMGSPVPQTDRTNVLLSVQTTVIQTPLAKTLMADSPALATMDLRATELHVLTLTSAH